MKCRYCQSEWKTPAAISVTMTTCPFCGKSLAEEKPLDTAEAVIASIYRQFGEASLRNGKYLMSIFSDLAPELKQDKRMLSYLVGCNGHVVLLDACSSRVGDPGIQIEKLVFQLEEEYLVPAALSRRFCEKFWIGIGGSPLPQSGKGKDGPPIPPRQPDPAPAPPKKPSSTTIVAGDDFRIKGRTLLKYRGTSPNPRVPDGIRIIGENAFKDNKIIRTVTLPDTVIKIKERAFSWCVNLESINLPSGLESIGVGAFIETGLKNVTLPDSLVSLGMSAFENTKLTYIQIPGGVSEVAQTAFAYCHELREAVLCQGVEQLAGNAFAYCEKLNTITIPDSVKKITIGVGRRPFVGMDNIREVRASDRWKRDNPEFMRFLIPSPIDRDNFAVRDGVLVRYYGRSPRPVIPGGVTAIGKDAFSQNNRIEAIVIPEGVRTIEQYAFWACRKLSDVSLPRSLEIIEDSAFRFIGISALVIPPNVHTVGNDAFCFCSKLCEITIPDSLVNLSSTAFSESNQIRTIHASQAWKQKHKALLDTIIIKRKK